VQPPLLGLVQ